MGQPPLGTLGGFGNAGGSGTKAQRHGSLLIGCLGGSCNEDACGTCCEADRYQTKGRIVPTEKLVDLLPGGYRDKTKDDQAAPFIERMEPVGKLAGEGGDLGEEDAKDAAVQVPSTPSSGDVKDAGDAKVADGPQPQASEGVKKPAPPAEDARVEAPEAKPTEAKSEVGEPAPSADDRRAEDHRPHSDDPDCKAGSAGNGELEAQTKGAEPGPKTQPETKDPAAPTVEEAVEAAGIPSYQAKVVMLDPRPAKEGGTVGLVGFSDVPRDVANKVCEAPFLANHFDLGPKGISLEAPETLGDPREFSNAEAAFQATKYWRISKQFHELSGLEAREVNRRLSSAERESDFAGFGGTWGAMRAVLAAKFAAGSALAAQLVATGDAFLLQHCPASAVSDAGGEAHMWSNNFDGEGKNWLGYQLMLHRARLPGGDASWSAWLAEVADASSGRPRSAAAEAQWQEAVRTATRALTAASPVPTSPGRERERAAKEGRPSSSRGRTPRGGGSASSASASSAASASPPAELQERRPSRPSLASSRSPRPGAPATPGGRFMAPTPSGRGRGAGAPPTPGGRSMVPSPSGRSMVPSPSGRSIVPSPSGPSMFPSPSVRSMVPAPSGRSMPPTPSARSMPPTPSGLSMTTPGAWMAAGSSSSSAAPWSARSGRSPGATPALAASSSMVSEARATSPRPTASAPTSPATPGAAPKPSMAPGGAPPRAGSVSLGGGGASRPLSPGAQPPETQPHGGRPPATPRRERGPSQTLLEVALRDIDEAERVVYGGAFRRLGAGSAEISITNEALLSLAAKSTGMPKEEVGGELLRVASGTAEISLPALIGFLRSNAAPDAPAIAAYQRMCGRGADAKAESCRRTLRPAIEEAVGLRPEEAISYWDRLVQQVLPDAGYVSLERWLGAYGRAARTVRLMRVQAT